MDVTAQLRNIRLSARKAKLVIDVVRGLALDRAMQQLKVMRQGAAVPVAKLILSAAANAKHNYKLEPGSLWVKRIEVGQGPRLKRFTPRAQGRATPILKPTSHVVVVLSDDARHRGKQ